MSSDWLDARSALDLASWCNWGGRAPACNLKHPGGIRFQNEVPQAPVSAVLAVQECPREWRCTWIWWAWWDEYGPLLGPLQKTRLLLRCLRACPERWWMAPVILHQNTSMTGLVSKRNQVLQILRHKAQLNSNTIITLHINQSQLT